ncbi:MAG TPA: ABC transporter ATP-binding protein [Symbiobacteriaceae bacterium]|nr:ABC transporter ATP-binding protein [Symbiobacteriaceae bacterium]
MSEERKQEPRQQPRPGGFGGGPMGGGMMPVQKAKDFKGTLRRLLAYLRPQLLPIIGVLSLAIISTIFSIVSPKIMGKMTTKLFEGLIAMFKHVPGAGIDWTYIEQVALLLTSLYLLSAAFMYAQQWLMAGIAQKIVFNLRQDLNAKLSRLPLKFFDGRTHGEILSRVTNDIDTIATTLQQSLAQLITSIVTVLGIIVMMLTISGWLTLVTIITLPLSGVLTALIAKKSQGHFKAQAKGVGDLNGHVEEMFTGHRIVKAYGREAESVAQFEQVNQGLYEAGWKAQFISGLIFPMINFVNNLGYVLVCVVGGVFVTQGRITIGDVQAFIQYSRQFGFPIAQLANIANVIQSTIASAERVFELLNESEELPDATEAVVLESVEGHVSFDQVAFGYKEGDNLIENMNIDVKPGQITAIVGPTGAGKTTLVNLLMRFYELNGGAITIDGVNIQQLKRGALRTTFGMVLQDTWLFTGTIRENLAYGRPGASELEIIQAAKAAQADHFIRTLPEGYDTVLNEDASNISQGQKQLLTIARAILADPAILILDEATSSVDTRTEVQIQAAMAELMKGRTSFVIAHRLSTIRDADLILVMNHGSVIEQGTHQELLAAGGFYAELYNSQFTGAALEAV